MSNLGDLVRRSRELLGLSQQALAESANYSVAGIRKIESGTTRRVNNPSPIIRALNLTEEDWAAAEAADRINKFGTEPNAARIPEIGKRSPRGGEVPVVGRAAASGDNGKLVMLNEITEYVPRHPDLDGVSDGFAVYVYGDSMEPRYHPNERVYVHPYRPCARGDYCVVQIGNPDPEFAVVKRFVSMDDKELVLEQFNPPKKLTFKKADVHSIGLIVGTGRS